MLCLGGEERAVRGPPAAPREEGFLVQDPPAAPCLAMRRRCETPFCGVEITDCVPKAVVLHVDVKCSFTQGFVVYSCPNLEWEFGEKWRL